MAVLERESRQGSAAYRSRLAHMREKVSSGSTLAEAMRACGSYFPPLACELVEVGEATGRLDSVLARLGEHYQHVQKLRRTFLLGIIWPAIELVGAVLIIGLLIFFLGILGTSTTIMGLAGPRGFVIYCGIILAIAAVVAVGIVGLVRGWFGAWPAQILVRLPVVGRAIRTMALARLSWTLSLALDAGIDAGRSIRMAIQSTQNSYFTRHADAAVTTVLRGGQFHEALEKTGAFPHDFLSSLETAEVSGTESESLSRLSAEYQQQAESAMTALTIAASVAIWMLVAALIIAVIFYMITELYLKPINDALKELQM